MNTNQLYLMLVYSEAILSHMETEYKPQIRVALDACWSFVLCGKQKQDRQRAL